MDKMQMNDEAFLYVLFTFQCLALAIGLPYLLMQCSSPEKRMALGKGGWAMKMILMGFVFKWVLDTYELVNEEASRQQGFDPYKLLHIDNDGSFGTKEIKDAYHRLALKYHPDKVNLEKIPIEKARARFDRLVKAYETLTKQDKFDNYIKYGDPDGSKTVKALELALPTWLASEELRPQVLTVLVIAFVFAALALKVWRDKVQTETDNGILIDSKANMREFILAILKDNENNERMNGFTDQDIIEIYETSIEIMAFNDELAKKITFSQIVQRMVLDFDNKRVREKMPQAPGDACCGGPMETPEQIVKGLVPRLNETIIEILQEEPFKGEASIVTGGEPIFFKPEMLITSISAFTLRVMEQTIVQRRKITFTGEVAGVPAMEPIRVNDLLTVTVNIEKLPFMKLAESKHKVFVALANETTNQVMIDEIEPSLAKDKRKYMVTMRQPGKNKFKAYVFCADGQIESSFP